MVREVQQALVLGASGGIGGAVVRTLRELGIGVTAVGRRVERLQALAAATGCAVACGNLDDTTFREELESRVPVLDVLVAAVGIAHPEPLLESDPENWARMMRTNVLSVMSVVVAAARGMVERRTGTIVIVGSVLARGVMPNAVAYAASKHALAAFTKGLRLELTGTGVRVVEIAPGLVGGTEFHRHADHPALAGTFANRSYEPITTDDVAACVRLAVELPENAEITTLEVRPRGQFHQG